MNVWIQTCTGSCAGFGSGQLAKLHEPIGKARGGTLLDAPAGAAIGDIRLHSAPAMPNISDSEVEGLRSSSTRNESSA